AEFDLRCEVEVESLPHYDALATSHHRLRAGLKKVIERIRPAMVMVQGDTLTAYSGARAAHDVSIALAHVEAGLRSGTFSDPFPEEWFRSRVARFANLHFAPSASAVRHLLAEGVDKASIHHVGNTGID